MSGNPWHKRYHSDALAGYMPLTLEERGAYTTFLDMLYDAGEALVEHERLFSGYMGCSLRKYRSVRDELIRKGKIKRLVDGRLSNSRFEKEVENAAKLARKRAENGSKGGKASGEARQKANEYNEGGEANASSLLKPIPEARSQKPEEESAAQPLQGAARGETEAKTETDPTRRERLLAAMGADPASGLLGPNSKVLGRELDMIEADRWERMGIPIDTQCRLIVEKIAAMKAANPHFQPRSFGYFTGPMEDFVAARDRPASVPRAVSGGGETPDQRRARWDKIGRTGT